MGDGGGDCEPPVRMVAFEEEPLGSVDWCSLLLALCDDSYKFNTG
jgi:hypothetical protein